jgi:hypothetical protein
MVQGRNGRLDAGLRLAALQAQAVDLPLHVLGARLGTVDQQFGAPFRLAHDAGRFIRGVVAHVVGNLLRAHQRRLQAVLEVAVLCQCRLEPRDFLAQPIVLTQSVLEAFGGLEQERRDLGAIEAAHRGAEAHLPHVDRADGQAAVGERRATRFRFVRGGR